MRKTVQIGPAGSNAITLHILPNGETQMSGGDPWYRLFRALADLYLTGEISADTLFGEITRWLDSGPRLDYLKEHYPAAWSLGGRISLAMMEPNCPCDPYRETPCECPPMDRRARLRDLIGSYPPA